MLHVWNMTIVIAAAHASFLTAALNLNVMDAKGQESQNAERESLRLPLHPFSGLIGINGHEDYQRSGDFLQQIKFLQFVKDKSLPAGKTELRTLRFSLIKSIPQAACLPLFVSRASAALWEDFPATSAFVASTYMTGIAAGSSSLNSIAKP